MLALAVSVFAGAFGRGISSAFATNMFRPEPAYLVSSLCFSRSNCSVGSSVGAATRAVLPLAELRRAAGRGFVTCVGAGEFDVFADAGEFELLNNAFPAKITASAPSTRAQISLVRFSAPIFNYPPDFK